MFLVEVKSSLLGWTALTLPAAVGTNTNAVPCANCSEVRFHFSLVRVASTNVQFGIQTSNWNNPLEAIPAASWENLKSESIIAGVGTLSTYSQIDTAAATRTFSSSVALAGARFVRLVDVYGANSTTDTLTISATLVQER